MPVYDKKYIKSKIKIFNGVVRQLGLPKKGAPCTCIASISIDSVMKMEKKNYPQVYSEECKYKTKKRKVPGFIDVELESDSSSYSE